MKKLTSLILIISGLLAISCKKKAANTGTDPRIPPALAFKTSGNYVSKDTTVVKQDTLLFGIVVTKTEDNLTSFNASSAFDGSATTTSFFNHHMLSSEYGGYSVDLLYYTRNQAGTETLTFTVVDRDGNITKKTIVITVI